MAAALVGTSLHQFYRQTQHNLENQLNIIMNTINENALLMRQAELTNSRHEAKPLINKATELKKRMASTFRYDHLDYRGLS